MVQLVSGTISEIKIISRNPNEGFARQNDLVPGKWVNIYFGGEYPTVITWRDYQFRRRYD
jgi:hypothetical protein